MDGIVIRAGLKNIVVERLYGNAVADRYTTDDLAKKPKRCESWMHRVIAIGEYSKLPQDVRDALIPPIKQPLIPSLESNVYERLAEAKRDMNFALNAAYFLAKTLNEAARQNECHCNKLVEITPNAQIEAEAPTA